MLKSEVNDTNTNMAATLVCNIEGRDKKMTHASWVIHTYYGTI